MRLYTFRDGTGGYTTGSIDGSQVVVPDAWRDGISGASLDDPEGYLATLDRGDPSDRYQLSDLRPGPAIPRPGKIVCVGLNYREHVTEGGRPAPSRPLLFAKFANAVVADGEPIVRPLGTHALDLEVELGVVIGRTASRVARSEAMEHVAGYVVVNDVSARDWQGVPAALAPGQKGDGQWLRAKGSDTFLPMGPIFVTADELDPADGLQLRSWRITPDGETHLMQDGTTADLVWDVPALIESVSASITLDPGDVIATGTPAGVGVYRDPPVFLEPGDRARCEIEGIGSVENPIVEGSGAATG
jgi:2-keto-4-pentenoate hydratase/2-oxohepta-3-ene-1,7-dioic acid hydratase in catechol pathway